MKKKGFTLIELLVVIAIIAMLLAILMPALGKVKKMAQRLVCGTNLKGLANSLNVYAFDYRDEFPVAGGEGTNTWTEFTPGWSLPAKIWSGDDNVSIAASLFMLVREADVGTKSFVCRGGTQIPFENPISNVDMIELWDFGGNDAMAQGQTPSNCQSYAYQIPYDMFGIFNYPATATTDPGNAVMADRNPWCDDQLRRAAANADDFLEIVQVINPAPTASRWEMQVGNSAAHDREGQNVLFGDGHVSFERRPDVAARYDNIYTVQQNLTPMTEVARRIGEGKYQIGLNFARNRGDSNLLNDEQCMP